MAHAPYRSCNRELNQGSIDGTYKQVNPNRGGVVESTTWNTRKDLSPTWHGIDEAAMKEMPDGIGPMRTPTTVAVEHNDCGCA
jgi:hypothetical protein